MRQYLTPEVMKQKCQDLKNYWRYDEGRRKGHE